jgi:hypothetical protein
LGCGLAAVTVAQSSADPRSVEILRLDCTTGPVRNDVTLFGNGTLRLRSGETGQEELMLSELDGDSFDAYIRRLQQESLGDGLAAPRRMEGLWTEQCVLTAAVPDGPSGTEAFSGLDSLSLPLSRVVSIARELMALARVQTHVAGIPPGYVPQRGDVLLHRDGSRYLVYGETSDGKGVELMGLDQPLTLYVVITDLQALFLAVEEHR